MPSQARSAVQRSTAARVRVCTASLRAAGKASRGTFAPQPDTGDTMSNDPFSIQVPNFATAGLSDAVNAIVAALAAKKFGATSTNAAAAAQSLAEVVAKLRAI